MSTVKSWRFLLLIPMMRAFRSRARFISAAFATSTSGSMPIARLCDMSVVSCSSLKIATISRTVSAP